MYLVPVLLASFGCANQPEQTDLTPTIAAADYERTFNAAVEALRAKRFRIDRQDYRYGVITTRPRGAPTVVEVWDDSNSTLGQAIESTFNDQRRVVRVTLEPGNISTTPPNEKGQNKNDTNADQPDTPSPAPAGPALIGPAASYTLRVEAIIERLHDPRRHLSGSTAGHRTLANLRTVPAELRQRGVTGPFWQAVRRDPHLEKQIHDAIAVALAQ